jgi:hypothetical protein
MPNYWQPTKSVDLAPHGFEKSDRPLARRQRHEDVGQRMPAMPQKRPKDRIRRSAGPLVALAKARGRS